MGQREKKPTDAELSILSVLWEKGPNSVRHVYRILAESREIGYTTVLKTMQIMVEKGLLVRDESLRPQIYRPARPRRHTQQRLLKDLLERVFKGSSGSMVLQILTNKETTREERQKIRELLDRLEEEEA